MYKAGKITGGSQDGIGHHATSSHLGSLSHKRLDQVIFWGPFQRKLFCEIQVLRLLKKQWKTVYWVLFCLFYF